MAQGVSVLRLSLDVMVREGETRRGQLVEVGGVGEGEVVCPKRRAHVIDLRVACGVRGEIRSHDPSPIASHRIA